MTGSAFSLSNLELIHTGGLTQALAEAYREAAVVCLARNHSPPTEVEIGVDGVQTTHTLNWTLPTPQIASAWANTDDATRDGAYSVSLAALHLREGLRAIKRAERLTGADYYVAPDGVPADDLENSFRLEVSGTDGSRSDVRQRLASKREQTKKGRSNLPALAAVVGFKEALVEISYVK